MLTKTRLFFERTTKMNISLTALGSVYRNSKWTDLKIINVQQNSLRQFVKLIFLIVFCIYFFDLIYRMRVLPCTDFIYETVYFSTEALGTWITWVFYSFSYLLGKCADYIRNLFFPQPLATSNAQTVDAPSKSNLMTNSKLEINKVPYIPTLTPSIHASTSTNPGLLQSPYLATLYLEKVVKSLHATSRNPFDTKGWSTNVALNLYKVIPLTSAIPNILFISSRDFYNLPVTPTTAIVDPNTKFSHITAANLTLRGIATPINNRWLSMAPISHYFLLNHIIEQNLRVGKEQKWLMKQTLLSSELSLNINKYVQLQKSYGYAGWSLYSRDNNVWSSLRVNNIETPTFPLNLANNPSYIKVLRHLSTNDILNTAHITDSLFWITKRFKHLQTSSTYLQKTDVHFQTFYSKDFQPILVDAAKILPTLYFRTLQNVCTVYSLDSHTDMTALSTLDFFAHFSSNRTTSTTPKSVYIYNPLSI